MEVHLNHFWAVSHVVQGWGDFMAQCNVVLHIVAGGSGNYESTQGSGVQAISRNFGSPVIVIVL